MHLSWNPTRNHSVFARNKCWFRTAILNRQSAFHGGVHEKACRCRASVRFRYGEKAVYGMDNATSRNEPTATADEQMTNSIVQADSSNARRDLFVPRISQMPHGFTDFSHVFRAVSPMIASTFLSEIGYNKVNLIVLEN